MRVMTYYTIPFFDRCVGLFAGQERFPEMACETQLPFLLHKETLIAGGVRVVTYKTLPLFHGGVNNRPVKNTVPVVFVAGAAEFLYPVIEKPFVV